MCQVHTLPSLIVIPMCTHGVGATWLGEVGGSYVAIFIGSKL